MKCLPSALMFVCIPSLAFSQAHSSPAQTSIAASSAQAPQQDPRAVAALNQAIAGLGRNFLEIRDFEAKGEITYFYGEENVVAPITLKWRSPDQFKLETRLQKGDRSFVVSNGHGSVHGIDGQVEAIPYFNAIKSAIPVIPQTFFMPDLLGSGTEITMGPIVELNKRTALAIKIQPRLTPEQLSKCVTCRPDHLARQILVDPVSGRVLQIADFVHPSYSPTVKYDRQFDFEEYASLGGIFVPTLVRETIHQTKLFEIHITSLVTNNGFSDSDFVVESLKN